MIDLLIVAGLVLVGIYYAVIEAVCLYTGQPTISNLAQRCRSRAVRAGGPARPCRRSQATGSRAHPCRQRPRRRRRRRQRHAQIPRHKNLQITALLILALGWLVAHFTGMAG